MPKELAIHRFIPEAEMFYGYPPAPDGRYFDGKFHQPAEAEECTRRREAIHAYEPDNHGAMPLRTYQDWVELDWKVPHATYEAFTRFDSKLHEEAVKEAGAEFNAAPTPHQRANGEPFNNKELVSELGDSLWILTALVSNSGIDIQQAMAEYLHDEELRGIRSPEISIAELDYNIATDYIPLLIKEPFVIRDPDDDKFIPEDEMDPISNMHFRTAHLRRLCNQQYGYGDEGRDVDRIDQAWFQIFGQNNIAPIAADHIMMVAYYAQVWAKSSLAEVVKKNIQKVSGRVIQNLVDKSDGERPEDLL